MPGWREPMPRRSNAPPRPSRRSRADLPEQAQYAVPMAFRVRWRIKLNLRAAYHLAELRSAPQGHPAYRRIAQAIYTQIRAVHPALAEGMRFVDMGDYELERLDAERRLDAKLSRAGRRWVGHANKLGLTHVYPRSFHVNECAISEGTRY